MGCRLTDQVVTFPLGGENARCGNAMRGERLDQPWHRGRGGFPSVHTFAFYFKVECLGQTQTKSTNTTFTPRAGAASYEASQGLSWESNSGKLGTETARGSS